MTKTLVKHDSYLVVWIVKVVQKDPKDKVLKLFLGLLHDPNDPNDLV